MRVPITPVTTLARELRDRMRRTAPAGRVIVAVDGADATATARFADTFAAVLSEDGSAVYRSSIDGFRRPRSERLGGAGGDAQSHYRHTYDYATLRRVLTDPFRDGWRTSQALGFQLAAYDPLRDAPVESRWMTAPDDAVLVVDGVFLHRPELRGLWDWSVRLDAAASVPASGSDPAVGTRREGAEDLYLRESHPKESASAVVDDTDPAHPIRLPAGAE